MAQLIRTETLSWTVNWQKLNLNFRSIDLAKLVDDYRLNHKSEVEDFCRRAGLNEKHAEKFGLGSAWLYEFGGPISFQLSEDDIVITASLGVYQ